MRLRIATILVGHERPAYLEALEKIDAFFAERLPTAIRSTIVVDNSRPRCEFERLGPNTVVIGGDNALREFSAWDRGIAHLDRTRENPDLVHLATSAFDSLYTGYIDHFGPELLGACRRARAVVGHIDYFDDPVEILGRGSQAWIRTSFFFVPPSALSALRSVVSFERPEELFTGDPGAPFRSDAPLSKRLQDFVVSWLTGEGTGQGVVWHSRFELSRETFDRFATKTVAIVNEHMLSVRLRELGVPLVDVRWLSRRLAQDDPAHLDWTRSWAEQIAERPE